MEYVILGFLCLRDLSQYDLLKAFEQRVSPFYSASLGSIQTRLKKLEKEGYITCKKIVENGRSKNVYSVNDEGRKHFIDWMMSDVSEKKFEAQMSTKIFFMGLISKEQRISVIKGFINHLEDALEQFYITKKESALAINNIKAEHKDIVYYQLKTLDLGISEYEDLLAWCKDLLEEIKTN